ncbi:MAG: DNA pilot protein [Microvirus sp.]|nr:MAG: DNA pilot protein [Microvirus sp.]
MGLLDLLGGLGGSLLDRAFSHHATHQQRADDSTLIQRRVEDAKRAGVSPLFALGANVSPSPVHEVGSTFSRMGQDFTRALSADMDAPSRGASKAMMALQLERGGLENELLRRQIAQIGVGVPARQPHPVIPGQAPRDPDATPLGIVLPNGSVMETGATSPSNTVEQQYGDVVQNVHGMWRLLEDGISNLKAWDERQNKMKPVFVPRRSHGRFY